MFKAGDIVKHKLTKENLIFIGEAAGRRSYVVVRRPDYNTITVKEEELELVQ